MESKDLELQRIYTELREMFFTMLLAELNQTNDVHFEMDGLDSDADPEETETEIMMYLEYLLDDVIDDYVDDETADDDDGEDDDSSATAMYAQPDWRNG